MKLSPLEHNGDEFLDVPLETGLNGFYLLSGSIISGTRDVNGDGLIEQVFIYPKNIIGHGHLGASMESDQTLFMNIPEVALEIAPLQASRYIGTIQIANRPYGMEVLYRGKPVNRAEVMVLTENGWRKSLFTDEKGRFTIILPEGQRWETYLYAAAYLDVDRNEYHIATLPMLIDPPWPEWSSWHGVLIFRSIAGLVFLLIMIAVFHFINVRRKKALLECFKNRKIEKRIS